MRWTTLCIVVLLSGASVRPSHAGEMREVLESAWSKNAEIATLQARRAEIMARKRAAGRLTPGPPSLGVGHLNDYVTGDDGYREYDVELGTPLWLPGEGTASRTLADRELARLQAQLALARLKVAGEVRDAYWSVRLGEGSVDLARRRLQAARTLQADVDRQVAAGQVAFADLLLAKGETLEAQSILSEQEAALTEARLAFQALTGAPSAADFAEPEPTDRGFEQHPRLVALRTTVDVAEANSRLIRIQDRDNPEVAFLGVVERQLSNEPYDKRIGVRVTIPFATEGRNAPRRAASEAERVQALAELQTAERQVRAEVGGAEADLASAQERASLADQRHRAFAERLALVERSVRVGETAFVELVRARAGVFETDLARLRSEIASMQARSRLNQALGLLP
ncbi:MAG: TolC family protein [Rhodospirillales bacterium]|nr:TolC family protein [Rhodospirillales bacterium]